MAPYILGDGGYPNLPWLVTVFPGHDTNLPSAQRRFNFAHSSARNVIERAFGRLKGRWRILMSKLRHKVEFVPAIIMACVILHNWLISKSDIFDLICDDEADPQVGVAVDEHSNDGDKSVGVFKRNLLMDHINHKWSRISDYRKAKSRAIRRNALLRLRRA